MDIKWISTREEPGENLPPAGKKKLGFQAVCGFLAFLLGISFLLEGGLFFGAKLSSANGRQWIEDSFQEDYRDTQRFRDYASDRLLALISMGLGGSVYRSDYDYNSYASNGFESWQAGVDSATNYHNYMSGDKNLLYTVAKGAEVLYTNAAELSAKTTAGALPDGYHVLLQFAGGKVRIWQDTEELDIYGDGYYDHEAGGQWYVPGYENFMIDEDADQLQVTMAVIDTPRIFIKGTTQYDYLYQLQRSLQEYQQQFLTNLALLSVGVLLLVLYVLLRKSKKRADQALARGTGRMWFEGKVIVFLILFVCLLPRSAYLGELWSEIRYASSTSLPVSEVTIFDATKAEATSEYGGAVYHWGTGDGLTYLTSNSGWMLREYLTTLAQYPIPLLLIFWGFYLLIFNDWRYNKKPWRHGIFGMLAARDLTYLVQKRLSRMAGMTALAFLCILVSAPCLALVSLMYSGREPLWWSLAGVCVLALVLLGWALRRQRRIWLDLGGLSDQVARLRAGQIDAPLELPPNHDLYQTADDLNHVQQGLHQAVEERTRSERMKVELVTNVSHDLKTPLTSIISYAELLAQEPLEPPASEYVQILNAKSQRLKVMVQDVFEVSKAASGQLPVELEALDFARLLRQTLADMAQSIEASGLVLRTAIPDEPVPITADSERMYRVFQNLIGNALKYSLSGSRVYLTLSVEGGLAIASVKNTSVTELNPGADYTGRFVRGDGSRTDGGSGLGLSIADSFTSACGGTLSVTTEADLFTASITFPLRE